MDIHIKVSVPFRGISFLNSEKSSANPSDKKEVSVPFRGISFLNTPIYDYKGKYKNPFPSPSGVSHFSISDGKINVGYPDIGFRPLPGYLISQSSVWIQLYTYFSFPSPSGVSHFSIKGLTLAGEIP